MKAQHTPGPWNYQREQWGGFGVINSLPDIETDKRIAIAAVPSGEANARLIAAAPELLEACQLALGALAESDRGEYPSVWEQVRIPVDPKIAGQALLKAIASATGKDGE